MTQAVAADYADAMLVARRAKNVLFFFVALVLLIQLAIFFTARYVPNFKIHTDLTTTSTESSGVPTTMSVTVIDRRPTEAGVRRLWSPAIQYVIAATDFLGVILSMALSVVLVILIMIMLVGRLVGVSYVTSALCWSILLIVMLFPWQSLLNSHARVAANSVSSTQEGTTAEQAPDLRVPGVLYTYPEFERDYDFSSSGPWQYLWLKWARFVAFPVVALIILLRIQGRSRRGLRFALGEAEMVVAKEE